jgi:hypothetical protein
LCVSSLTFGSSLPLVSLWLCSVFIDSSLTSSLQLNLWVEFTSISYRVQTWFLFYSSQSSRSHIHYITIIVMIYTHY